jgi:ABC-2 type transport system ATP-binding protein
MKVDQLLSYTRAFYPTWDEAYADELVGTLELDTGARVKHLSKGQHARLGLILALAHHPELLILDEPSSGLDPVVRRDILEAVIQSISEAGCTVVFSSHLLDEVERVSDYVAMLKSGRLLMCDSLEAIKGSYRVLTLSFEDTQPTPPGCPPAISWSGSGREWTAVCRTLPDDLAADVTMIGGQIVDSRVPTLDEIFIAHSVPTSKP